MWVADRRNSTSLLELLRDIRELLDREIEVEWGAERLADQRWYVADTSKIESWLGWVPSTSIQAGLRALRDWYRERPTLVGKSVTESEVQVA